jgi:hypothetical protein
MFSVGFTPAFNKDGLSKMRFIGTEQKSGEKIKVDADGKEIIDPETNEPQIINWSLINLKFEVMGVVKGQWQEINITCGEKYTRDNILGVTLNKMGFIPYEGELETDDEGFGTIELETDEDGFCTMDGSVIAEIEDFLLESVGGEYTARVFKATEGRRKNFWQIDVNTIKPYIKKASKK